MVTLTTSQKTDLVNSCSGQMVAVNVCNSIADVGGLRKANREKKQEGWDWFLDEHDI